MPYSRYRTLHILHFFFLPTYSLSINSILFFCCFVCASIYLFIFHLNCLLFISIFIFLNFFFFIIFFLFQNPIINSDIVDFVVTTEDVTLSQVQAFADKVSAMPFSQTKPLFMPILI